MKHANKGIHPCFEIQKSSDFTTGISGPVKKVLCPPKFLKKEKKKIGFYSLIPYFVL